MTRAPIAAALALALALAAAACGGTTTDDGLRGVVVRELAAAVIVPTFDAVAARAGELRGAAEALAADPTPAALAAAQAAWRAARAPWKEAVVFGFGPGKDLRLTVAIDQSPIVPAYVEQEIAGDAPITDAYVERLGANRKGFHALEYLAFGDDALAPLAAEPRRRELAAAYARVLASDADALRAAWADEHAAAFAAPGPGNAAYPTVKVALDAIVNELVFQSEWIADQHLGKPLGLASGGAPRPELEESGPSDHSTADMAGALRGIRNAYLGTRDGAPGRGLGHLLAAYSVTTDAEVRAALDAALAAVAAIPRPFRAAVVDHRDDVLAAHAAVKELKRILATEVIALLGVTLGFNDNDGD